MSTTESHNEAEVVVDPNAVSMTINGKSVQARKGEWIIAAADRTEDFIPRFCYHPRMESVGMCRQCLVEVEGPRGRRRHRDCAGDARSRARFRAGRAGVGPVWKGGAGAGRVSRVAEPERPALEVTGT